MPGISLSKSSNEKVTFEASFVDFLRSLDPEIQLEEFERSGSVNMWEWALPAGVVVVFAKPFFDAFMKKLGDAAGTAVVDAVKKQFGASKSGSEKLHNVQDIEELQKRLDTFEGDDDEAWQKHVDDIGKKIAPLELRVSEAHWITPNGYELVLDYRFVFTADLTLTGVAHATELLAKDQDRLLQRLPIEFPALLKEAERRENQRFPGTVEAVFDVEEYEWTSFPTMRARLKAKKNEQE